MSKLTHFGEWSDRYNERQSYFSGSEYGQKLCECGIKDPNECFQLSNSQNMCNCDQKDPVERNDIGYITNMVRTFICFVLYLPKIWLHGILNSHPESTSKFEMFKNEGICAISRFTLSKTTTAQSYINSN